MTLQLSKTCLIILAIPSKQIFCIILNILPFQFSLLDWKYFFTHSCQYFYWYWSKNHIWEVPCFLSFPSWNSYGFLLSLGSSSYSCTKWIYNIHTTSIMKHFVFFFKNTTLTSFFNLTGDLFLWGNPTEAFHIHFQNSFYDMLITLVNCTEPISLI